MSVPVSSSALPAGRARPLRLLLWFATAASLGCVLVHISFIIISTLISNS